MGRTLGLLLGTALCLSAADADRYYLKIDGIAGNAVFQSDSGWIPIDGYEADQESLGDCDGWVKCFNDGAPVALIVRRHHDAVSAALKAAAEDQRLLPDLMIVYNYGGGGSLVERTGLGSVHLSDFRSDGDKETFRLRFGSTGEMSSLTDDGPPVTGQRAR